MNGMLVTLAALVRKELLQAVRDRRMLAMLLVAPVMQITLFGYAANLEFNRAETVFVDEDRSPASRAFREGLAADATFAVRDMSDVAEAEAALRDGVAQIAVVLPRGFGRRVAAATPAHVQVLLDGSDPSRGVQAGAAIETYVATRSAAARRTRGAPAGAASVPHVVLEPRLLYNPGMKSRLFMVPGTAASILIIVTTIVTAMGLAREREMGTMEQLLVTPISPLTLMIGKTIPYALFGLVDEAFILIVGNVLFDVPIRGALDVVFAGALAYLVATLGIGLLISTLARTQQQALMAGFFFLLPAILLSGFMTPIDAMPSWIQPVTYLDPVRWFIEITRSVLLRGGGYADVARPLLYLSALGLFVLGFATLRFRRQLA